MFNEVENDKTDVAAVRKNGRTLFTKVLLRTRHTDQEEERESGTRRTTDNNRTSRSIFAFPRGDTRTKVLHNEVERKKVSYDAQNKTDKKKKKLPLYREKAKRKQNIWSGRDVGNLRKPAKTDTRARKSATSTNDAAAGE